MFRDQKLILAARGHDKQSHARITFSEQRLASLKVLRAYSRSQCAHLFRGEARKECCFSKHCFRGFIHDHAPTQRRHKLQSQKLGSSDSSAWAVTILAGGPANSCRRYGLPQARARHPNKPKHGASEPIRAVTPNPGANSTMGPVGPIASVFRAGAVSVQARPTAKRACRRVPNPVPLHPAGVLSSSTKPGLAGYTSGLPLSERTFLIVINSNHSILSRD